MATFPDSVWVQSTNKMNETPSKINLKLSIFLDLIHAAICGSSSGWASHHLIGKPGFDSRWDLNSSSSENSSWQMGRRHISLRFLFFESKNFIIQKIHRVVYHSMNSMNIPWKMIHILRVLFLDEHQLYHVDE